MHYAVLSGFAFALIAPFIYRATQDLAGWLIALIPAGLFVYFLGLIPALADGETFEISYAWVPGLGINFSFWVDGLSVLFALLITGIGALVAIYASSYLKGDELLGRFYAYLLMFMASMLGVVLANNILLLFVFWELTSISSYLLIGFDHEMEESRSAALQALLVTGGGGLALLVGLVLIGQVGGSSELSVLAAQGEELRTHSLYLPILLLVLVGAAAKSAQFPFHFWLPNAMAAPTPVSAYLHSATMVKAGIYLLARLSQSLGGTEIWFYLVSGVGLATLLVGAYLALIHSNMKRILAYSTISSLGIMTLLIGVGANDAIVAAIVFVMAHALYKGSLFLLAGAIYHETGTQDVDDLSGLRQKMPLLTTITFLAALSLAGVGPLISFIGKELMLESLLAVPRFGLYFTLGLVLSAAASVAVALILTIRPFFGELTPTPHPPHDPPLRLWLGPAVLVLLGLILGLFPGTAAGSIISPAASAVLGEPEEVKLALWHGFNLALGLSALSILLGYFFYRVWASWRRFAVRLDARFPWGPARGYDATLLGVTGFASRLTALLQSGHLHDYIMIVILTTTSVVGFTLISQGERYQTPVWNDLRFYEVILSFLILAGALVVTVARSRLVAVASLGVVGFGVTMIFVLFGAPDLAMTQVLIETVTVILLVLIIYHLPGFAKLSSRRAKARDAVLAGTAGGMMTILVLIANGALHFPPISSYFIENSRNLAHGRNIVNVILVDFRGLDTLGEITVLSLAGIGVYALLKLWRNR